MSRPISPIVCDGPGCGKQKQETNRWWQIAIDQREPYSQIVGAFRLPTQSKLTGARRDSFRMAIFDSAEPHDNMEFTGWTWYDACGETCVLKFVSEQMSKVTS